MPTVASMRKWLALGCLLAGCGGGASLPIAPAQPSQSQPDSGAALSQSPTEARAPVYRYPFDGGCVRAQDCVFNGENGGICEHGQCFLDCSAGLTPAWVVSIPNSALAPVSGPFTDTDGNLYVTVGDTWQRMTSTGEFEQPTPPFDPSTLTGGASTVASAGGVWYAVGGHGETVCAIPHDNDGARAWPSVPPYSADAGFEIDELSTVLAPGDGDLFTFGAIEHRTTAMCFPEAYGWPMLTKWTPALDVSWSCPLEGLNSRPVGMLVQSGRVVLLAADGAYYGCGQWPNAAQLIAFDIPGQQPALDEKRFSSGGCPTPW